jgi:TolB-like protein
MSLLAELRRRNVIRMAGLYLVGAWLVTQVAGTVLPMFGAPEWVARSVVLLLVIGFVPALVFAWVFELTPEGIKREGEVAPVESLAPRTARRMDRLLLVALLLALGYFAVDKFLLAPAREPAASAVATGAAAAAAPAPQAATVADPKSIAVLAFANRSADQDNEYFADGISDEILNALAQVEDLKVAGRTSSFYFKGRNESLATIGRTLGVAHVLEGSVRKQGDKLRIIATLLRVSDGGELWSETFDGTDADVFALQEKIARRVTSELKVALDAGQQTRLVAAGTTNPDAYALYLRASAIFDRRDISSFPSAVAALEQAIAMDPKFARAYSRLSALTTIGAAYGGVDLQQDHQRVMQLAGAALALDPTLAEPHAVMGQSFARLTGGLLQQRQSFERALQLDPDDVTSNFWFGLTLINTGYRAEGLARIERALALDPMLPNALRWRGVTYLFDGDLDRAEDYLTRARASGLMLADRELSEIAYLRGDAAKAIRLWPEGSRSLLVLLPPGSAEVLAAGIYGDAEARREALATLDAFLAKRPRQVTGLIPLALYRLGEPQRTIDLLMTTSSADNTDLYIRMWSPLGLALRQQPRFPEFLRAKGFFALWDQYGPPDLCRKAPDGGYLCQ